MELELLRHCWHFAVREDLKMEGTEREIKSESRHTRAVSAHLKLSRYQSARESCTTRLEHRARCAIESGLVD
jgi:hypothetical protein